MRAWTWLLLLAIPLAAEAQPILERTGRLSASSRRLTSGEYFEAHRLPVKRGQIYGVLMRAVDFQPYVIVGLGDDRQADDGGPSDAQLIFQAPRDMTVFIYATTKETGATGHYRLQVWSGALHGRLATGDSTLESGELFDGVSLFLDPSRPYTVRFQSTEFDPYLIVRNGTIKDEQAENVDISRTLGLNDAVRAAFTSSSAGRAFLYLTAETAGQSGAYVLTINPGFWPLSERREGRGTLSETDPKLRTGEHRHVLTFVAGVATYEVTLTSREFDAFLVVVDTAKQQHQDDNGGGGTDAKVTFKNQSQGLVRVIVTTRAAGETGAYRVAARQLK